MGGMALPYRWTLRGRPQGGEQRAAWLHGVLLIGTSAYLVVAPLVAIVSV